MNAEDWSVELSQDCEATRYTGICAMEEMQVVPDCPEGFHFVENTCLRVMEPDGNFGLASTDACLALNAEVYDFQHSQMNNAISIV